MVLRGEWTEIDQIWAGNRLIIGAVDVLLQIMYVAPFRNKGDSNANVVENRGQILYYLPPTCKIYERVGKMSVSVFRA